MHADRTIINFWLTRQGYSTVENIKVARNRTIDIIAARFKGSNVQATHVEVIGGLSGPPAGSQAGFLRYAKDRLLNKMILAKAKGYVKRHYGTAALSHIAVIGEFPKSKKGQLREQLKRAGIRTHFFEDVLFEVFRDLDMHDYQDETIRSLQIVKYQLLAKPETLARLLGERSIDTVLNTSTRGEFVGALLDKPEILKTMGRVAHEKRLIQALKASSLRRAERFAGAISEVVGKKAKKSFIKHLLAGEKAPQISKRRFNAQLDEFFS